MAWRWILVAAWLAGCGNATEPEILYQVQDTTFADHVQVDRTHVYWTITGGAPMRMPKDGGAVEHLFARNASCDDMVVDTDALYCAGSWFDWDLGHSIDIVSRLPKEGGDATRLWVETIDDPGRQPLAIAIDRDYVYWASYQSFYQPPTEPGRLYRIPKTGGDAELLYEGLVSGIDLAVDDDFVYWSDQYGWLVMRVPKVGGSAETLLSGEYEPRAIGLDETYVYVALPGSRENYFNDGSIRRRPKAGGAWQILAADRAYPWDMGVDTLGVVWIDGGAEPGPEDSTAILSLPRDGSIRTVGTGFRLPWSVGADETHVYWTTLDGWVVRAAR